MNTAYVYILTNENTIPKGITAKYNVYKLVYFESLPTICDAISREKYERKAENKNRVILRRSIPAGMSFNGVNTVSLLMMLIVLLFLRSLADNFCETTITEAPDVFIISSTQ